MAPLMVVQALAESEFATLSDIKVRGRGEGGEEREGVSCQALLCSCSRTL